MNRKKLTATLLSLLVCIAATAFAAPLDKIQFIKIAAQDSRAVIRNADGKMQVIKPKDTIVENVTVKEIIPGRIILEETTASGPETIIVRIDNGKTRIERLRKHPDKSQPLVAPATSQK
jgi:hypothetical protein